MFCIHIYQVLIFLVIKIVNLCQQVLKRLGSYTWGFTVLLQRQCISDFLLLSAFESKIAGNGFSHCLSSCRQTTLRGKRPCATKQRYYGLGNPTLLAETPSIFRDKIEGDSASRVRKPTLLFVNCLWKLNKR